MSNYVKTVNFAAKDALAHLNPAKVAKGTEVDTELNNIATAVATKEDTANKNSASGYAGLDSGSRLLKTTQNSATAYTDATNVFTLAQTFSGVVTVNSDIQAQRIGVGTPGAGSTGDLTLARSSTTGALLFGTSGTKYIYFDGTAFNVNGGSIVGAFTGALTGNASTATSATSATSATTATTATNVAASGITGTTLASGVTASSLTSFGASIALGTPGSGNLSSCTADGTNSVGFKNIPRSTTTTTIATTDVGKCIAVTANIAVPTSTFAAGDAVSIFNNSTASINITKSSGTQYRAGTDADNASIVLSARGVATVWFNSATTWVVSGNVS